MAGSARTRFIFVVTGLVPVSGNGRFLSEYDKSENARLSRLVSYYNNVLFTFPDSRKVIPLSRGNVATGDKRVAGWLQLSLPNYPTTQLPNYPTTQLKTKNRLIILLSRSFLLIFLCLDALFVAAVDARSHAVIFFEGGGEFCVLGVSGAL